MLALLGKLSYDCWVKCSSILLVFALILSLIGVNTAAAAAAAGGMAHDVVVADAPAASTAVKEHCPSHDDGHRMQQLKCQVACASMAPAMAVDATRTPAAVAPLFRVTWSGSGLVHDRPALVPTPPPNFT